METDLNSLSCGGKDLKMTMSYTSSAGKPLTTCYLKLSHRLHNAISLNQSMRIGEVMPEHCNAYELRLGEACAQVAH